MTTLLVPPERFAQEALEVEGNAFRHLFRARRVAPGARLRVVDGAGSARWATVASVGRRRARLDLAEPAPANEPRLRLEIWVAPPRMSRAGWMVEKLTELGVSAIHLWSTGRAPRRYGGARIERLRRVAVAAVEQCERSRLPEIAACSWEAGLEGVRACERRWLLAPGAPAPGPAEAGDAGPTALLVGPEGGWEPAELETLAELPCRPVGLGPTLLRVETAAVAGAALVLAGG